MSNNYIEKVSRVSAQVVTCGIWILLQINTQGSLLWSGTFNEKTKPSKQSDFLEEASPRQSKQLLQRLQSESVNYVFEKKNENRKRCFNVAKDSEWERDKRDETRRLPEEKIMKRFIGHCQNLNFTMNELEAIRHL